MRAAESQPAIGTFARQDQAVSRLAWPSALGIMPWVLGGGATLLALRLSAVRPLSFDEYHTWHQARLGSLQEVIQFLLGDVHPWLYLSTVWSWAQVFPVTAFGLRSLSAVAIGLATVIFWWAARRILREERAATIAALLFAISPVGLAYGAHARAYALGLLMCAILLWTISLSLSSRTRLLFPISAGLAGAALFYTHYAGLFFFVGLMLCWGFHAIRSREWRGFLITGVTSLLLILPWLPILLSQRSLRMEMTALAVAGRQDPSSLSFLPDGSATASFHDLSVRHAAALISNLAQLVGVIPISVFIIVLTFLPALLAMYFMAKLLLRGDGVSWMGLTLSAVVIVGVHSQGLLELKFIISVLPVLLLLLARALSAHWQGNLGLLARSTFIGLLLVFLMGSVRFQMMDYEDPVSALVEHVKESYEKDHVILFHLAHGEIPFEYHSRTQSFDPEVWGFPRSIREQWVEGGFRGWSMDVAFRHDIEALLHRLSQRQPKRLWIVLHESARFDPQAALLTALESHFGTLEEIDDPGWQPEYRLLRTLDGQLSDESRGKPVCARTHLVYSDAEVTDSCPTPLQGPGPREPFPIRASQLGSPSLTRRIRSQSWGDASRRFLMKWRSPARLSSSTMAAVTVPYLYCAL